MLSSSCCVWFTLVPRPQPAEGTVLGYLPSTEALAGFSVIQTLIGVSWEFYDNLVSIYRVL